jgi:hypothetical protein
MVFRLTPALRRKTWRVLVTKPSGRPEGAESRPRSWMRRLRREAKLTRA